MLTLPNWPKGPSCIKCEIYTVRTDGYLDCWKNSLVLSLTIRETLTWIIGSSFDKSLDEGNVTSVDLYGHHSCRLSKVYSCLKNLLPHSHLDNVNGIQFLVFVILDLVPLPVKQRPRERDGWRLVFFSNDLLTLFNFRIHIFKSLTILSWRGCDSESETPLKRPKFHSQWRGTLVDDCYDNRI